MTVSDFASKIKAKYPQYNTLSDQELTQKMLTKYPQYKSQVQITPEDKLTGTAKTITGITQGVGGALNSLGLGALSDIGQALPAAQIAQKATGINPMESSQLVQQKAQHPVQNAVQDVAGAASWLLPEGKVVEGAGLAGKLLNLGGRSVMGGLQGGLQALSQPGANTQSVEQGAATGAVANPLLSGAGSLLTKGLPSYLGARAYGKAGWKLPDVIQAEKQYGTSDLKSMRSIILDKSKDVQFDKNDIMDKIKQLSQDSSWIGTPGLSKIVQGSIKKGTKYKEIGLLKDIEENVNQSNDFFEVYSRLKNMAYPKGNSSSDYRLANFMKSAAHMVRESMIQGSKNPDETRHVMDMYAAQSAINAAKSGKNTNEVVNKIEKFLPEGESGLGVIGMIASVPGLHTIAPLLLADALISNKFVAPKLAGGLINMGSSSIAPLIRKLGVSSAVAANNQQSQ